MIAPMHIKAIIQLAPTALLVAAAVLLVCAIGPGCRHSDPAPTFQPPPRPLEQLRGAPAATHKADAPPDPSPAKPTEPRTYTIKRGDTLFSIAKRLLGDPKRYKEILQLNPQVTLRKLHPGAKIAIPPR